MITLPVVLTYKDISVYPDTEDCNLYYCLRTKPRIRIGEDGNPVFRGAFWSGSKASDKTVMGFMGGKLNFDTNLVVTEDEQEIIMDLIKARKIQQKRYNEIIAKEEKRENLIKTITKPSKLDEKRTKGNAMDGFLEGEAAAARKSIPSVGEISFGSVTFTGGSVDVLDENGGSLVEWHNGGGKPALFGDNNRATAMQLTPEGAAVFYAGIKGRTQAIAIAYDLKLQMAMPALDIRIYAGSVQAASISRLVNKGCTGNVKSREISEVLTDNSCIIIDIKAQSPDIDNDTVEKIHESMMAILDKKIEEIVKTKIAPLSPEERNGKTNLIIEEEFKSFTELTFSESCVFEFNIAPQATICDFFANVTEEQLKKMITVIDLSDEVFSFKEITLCGTAPWNEKPFVNLVKVECEYPSLPEGHKDRIKSFMFDKDNPTAEWSFMKPKDDKGVINYTPYVYLKGSSDCIKLPTQTAKGNYVIVNVGRIDVIEAAFRAHPNVTNLPGDLKVSGVQFELWYDDADGNRLMGPEQILINGDDLTKEVVFEKNLGVVLDQPVHYKTTYFFKSIDPITLPEKTFKLGDDGITNIFADFPFKNRRTLQVELPLVPDDNINDINGEIYYGKYVFPIDLSKDEEWEPVKVNLCTQEENVKDYTYKFYLKYENNEYDMVMSSIMKGDPDSSSLIVPLKRIEMAGIDLLELGEKYYRANVQITLPAEFGKPLEFHLSRKDKDIESKVFYIFCPADAKLELEWKLTVYDLEGQELPPVTGKTDKSFFIITPPKGK